MVTNIFSGTKQREDHLVTNFRKNKKEKPIPKNILSLITGKSEKLRLSWTGGLALF